MKQEVADKWCQALESGKYQQTSKVLCRTTEKGEVVGYCCLGILCEVYQQEVGDLDVRKINDTYNNDHVQSYEHSYAALPQQVQDWAGMQDCLGRYVQNGVVETLSDQNDNRKKNFVEIAAIIRANVNNL